MNPLLDSLREVLVQGEALLLTLDDDAYTTKIPVAFNATIGGHYRHCLDHFQSLFDGLDAAAIDYDARRRDPRVETQRDLALARTRDLLAACDLLDSGVISRAVTARSRISYLADDSPAAPSTVAREIMFCVSHAIHHYALIGVMCGMLDVPTPDGFGVAPATIRHRAETLAA